MYNKLVQALLSGDYATAEVLWAKGATQLTAVEQVKIDAIVLQLVASTKANATLH